MRVHRRGFTLIELLVVIAIIGVLLGLLLPAVMSARESMRRVACLSNMRNVGLAVLEDADVKKRFPGVGYFGASSPWFRYHSWVVSILPGIEQQALYKKWNFDLPFYDPGNTAIANTHLEILCCPSDDTMVPNAGNLSYVLNSGVGWTAPDDCPVSFSFRPMDLNGNGAIVRTLKGTESAPTDRQFFYWMGLCFIENWPQGTGTVRFHSPNSVLDGLSHTLLMSENVRAGVDPDGGTNWSWPHPEFTSFMMSGYICEPTSPGSSSPFDCGAGKVDYANANNHSPGPWADEAINSSLTQAEGFAPWPSSYHIGGVNVMFVGGNGRFVSDAIEGAVYATLVSPQGIKLAGTPLEQQVTADGEF